MFLIAAGLSHAQTVLTPRWPGGSSLNRQVSSSSPAVSADGSTIYIGTKGATSGRVVAINNDGSLKWVTRPDLPDLVDSSPTLSPDGTTVYAGCWDGRLYALDAATGAVRWAADTNALGVFSSPALSPGGSMIYIGGLDSALHAIDSATHTERWQYKTGDVIWSSPAVAPDGTIYVGCQDHFLYAVNPDSTLKWRFPTGSTIFDSSPAIGADGTIYIGSDDQRLYAVNPDGTKKWEQLTNGAIDTSPVLGAGGTIYFGSADRNLYGLNPIDGSVVAKAFVNSTAQSPVAVRADGAVFIQTDDFRVLGFNRDLTPLGVFDPQTNDNSGKGEIPSAPAIAPDGTIYVGSLDGHLYAINGNGSPLSSFSSWPMFRRTIAHRAQAEIFGVGARLVNLSTRAPADAGSSLIEGLVIAGDDPRPFLFRAAGPTLAIFGVPNPLADPTLSVLNAAGQTIAQNDNWENQLPGSLGFTISGTAAGVGAFPYPAGSKDAAVFALLTSGSYTALVNSVDGSSGITLVEAYDVPPISATHLVNLSTRGRAGTGDRALFGGLAVTGNGPVRLLVRGIGPGLTQFGVPNVVTQPTLAVFDKNGTEIRRNSGWTSGGIKGDVAGAAATAGAFALREDSPDAAAILTVSPGNYTIQVSGIGGVTAEALVEVYLLH
jgi:outer membrane protein assembly factor BamB